jgi:hypothetical protein
MQDKSAAIEILKKELGDSAEYPSDDQYDRSVEKAIQELGWGFPISANFKKFWFIERAKRHIFFFLQSESAHKFKYKQINLQNRFEHYERLIRKMDRDFQEAMDSNPTEFANVEPHLLFGHVVHAGFSYDEAGQDTTYEDDNQVDLFPRTV